MKRSTSSAPDPGRPGFQSRGGPGQRVRLGGRFTPGGLFILGVYAFTYLLLQLPVVGDFFADRFLLQPELALSTRPYQLLTAPLFMTSLLALAFLALLLWGVGSAVEQRLGTRRFLLWVGLTSLGASLAAAAVGCLLPGEPVLPVPLDNIALFPLVLLSFAQFYGGMRVSIWGLGPDVSGRALAYFFVGLGLGADLLARQWPQLAAASAAVVSTLLLGHGSAGLGAALRRRWQRPRPGASARRPPDPLDDHATPPETRAGSPHWLN